MELTRVVIVCLCTVVYFLEGTYGVHPSTDRRIVPGMSVMPGSPIPRNVAPTRPTGIVPTRNIQRPGAMISRGRFARYNQQPTWRFPNERIPATFPNGGLVPNVRSMNAQPAWASISIPQDSMHHQLPDTGAQPFNRRFIDAARNPFNSGTPIQNSARVINKPDPVSQSNKNSLLRLLEERRPVLRDDRDSQLIRTHLTELNNFRNDMFSNSEEQLQKQVNYIERILDIDIQREVLKIFVKDIVEKSGFLNMDATSVQDIASLQMLIDKINMVTKNFSNFENPLLNGGGRPGVEIGVVTTQNPLTTRDTLPTDVSRQEADLRRRISLALSSYSRPGQTPSTSRDTSNTLPEDLSLQTFQGRRPSVGMSIFGSPVDITTQSTTIVTETKRGINIEPLGGNTAYWTHLRSGLADMLCNLCQQQGQESCIQRYCTNTVIVEEATPRPTSTRTPIVLETTTAILPIL